jgi:uncharacterized protein (DUF58 family)
MPTREGLTVVALAGAVFLLATNLMSGLLFVLQALLLGLFVVGAAMALAPLPAMRVRRHIPARGLEDAPVSISIELTTSRSGRLLVVEDGAAAFRARTLLPLVPAGRPVTAVVRPVPRRRGHYNLGPVEVSSRGAVGLLTARRRFPVDGRIVVWPRAAVLPDAVRVRLVGGADGRPAGVRTRHSEDFYGVRDYQPGDLPNRIHWRSSARRGALVVREYERATRPAPAIVVDLDRGQSLARLDAAVRATASLLRALGDRWPNITTIAWAPLPTEQHGWVATMDWLAGVEPCGPPVWEVLAGPGPHAGRPLIVVASSLGRPDRAPMPRETVVVFPADDAPPRWPLVYAADGQVHAWQAGAA